MAILFAIGVVTGTILSFELGLLWPEFMATFGDVFGLAFGLEGFSFFTEAIFIAIYIYGWDRLPPRVHFLAGFPILIAGITGAFFVISVNGWMNDPTGFRIENGEIVDVKPVEALFNANMWHEFVHMYLAGIIVAGFLVAAVYAAGWLRGNRERRHRVALIVALSFASLAAPVQLFVGDFAARTVAERQPLKLAIFEGLPETESGAPLHIFGIYEDGEVKGGIEFPKLLSLLAYHDPNATVEGLDSAPPNGLPTNTGINIVRLSFQAMVFIGTGLAALAVWFLWFAWRRGRLPRTRWFMRALVVAGPLSVVALICGWVTTEVGRQPWIVYEVMRTEQAVTGAEGIPVGYATLVIVYLSLAVIAGVMLRRVARRPMEV
jgi:cytochrome d ubiquinol oxidase subunit I